ncbi:MAG: transglycosylase SLT domain-containing protein [Desulfobacteraceae bacterium]|nr:transglycosylase SLT domain-containing protein [Desulfobacteraceae bacterium]
MKLKIMKKSMKPFCLISILSACFCLFFLNPVFSFAEDNRNYNNEFVLPSLVESVRFSEPVFFCSTQIPVHRQDIKERLEKEILLALWDRPQVILWIKRASKFFPHIEKIIREADLPDDLKYVAVVESGLRPHVSSPKGAVGYWQFLRSTGKMYGLKINYKIDERRNLFKSTASACQYLKELNRQFDDWFLAVAAYNMGARRLKNMIEIQKSDKFYSLYLSEETQRYIFKIIAAKHIMENYQKFGFVFQKEDYYPVFEFDKININSSRQIPIALVAQSAGISFRTVKEMNPELRGYYLAVGENAVLVPKGLIHQFEARFQDYYAKWQDSGDNTIHRVRSGENLALIAKKYNVRLSSLIKWNNLSRRSIIHPGDQLIIESN